MALQPSGPPAERVAPHGHLKRLRECVVQHVQQRVCSGGRTRCIGQSVRGLSSVRSSSNRPDHASRLVRNDGRPNSTLAVAIPEVRSNCEVGCGPFCGALIAVFAGIHLHERIPISAGVL